MSALAHSGHGLLHRTCPFLTQSGHGRVHNDSGIVSPRGFLTSLIDSRAMHDDFVGELCSPGHRSVGHLGGDLA